VDLNLTPEDIEQLVKDTIMKSGFGKAVEDGIKKALAPSYDNPIDKCIKAYISQICGEVVKEKFTEQIREAVTKDVEERVTSEVIQTAVTSATTRMIRAAEESSY